MASLPRSVLLAAAFVACLGPSRAAEGAEPTDVERTLATALFEEGKKLMAEGRFKEACPKLLESHRLDPGSGTLLNVATCHEGEGKIATAWSEFHEARAFARKDGRSDREDHANARIAALEKQLPRLTIEVSRASDLNGLEIQLDGVILRRPTWGSAVPVDPGQHTLVVTAPGRRQWEHGFEIVPFQALRVDIPVLPPDVAPANKPEAVTARPVAARRPTPMARPLSHRGQIGVMARVDADWRARGAVVVFGPTYGIIDYLEVVAGPMVGSQNGAYVGALFMPLVGWLKPTVSVGVPVFFVDGVWPGVHASVGLQWDPSRHFGVLLQGGLEYFPTVPAKYEKILPVPSLGVQGRL